MLLARLAGDSEWRPIRLKASGRAKAKLAAGWNQAARATPSLARVRRLERPIIPETERERTGKAPRATSEKASPAPAPARFRLIWGFPFRSC